MKTILLFPPNWSLCVSGPHLALPLLTGIAHAVDWEAETWDLSEMFSHAVSDRPPLGALTDAAARKDCESLDNLYFIWEDECARHTGGPLEEPRFGLLSGVQYPHLMRKRLSEVAELVRLGTAHTEFYTAKVLPRLAKADPDVVGVTIASEAQIVPAIELLQLIRVYVPRALIIVGGNIVTRLRKSTAFEVLRSLADRIVIFQGERAFRQTLESVRQYGVEQVRSEVADVQSDELIPYAEWPTPRFAGVNFQHYVGIPTLSYVSTRGCYWGKCHFCAIPAGWSTRGYGGSAPGEFVVKQIEEMIGETGVHQIKFVDEAISPRKVRELSDALYHRNRGVEWEAYARLETAWENPELLNAARAAGLRKLYFGLEQAPSTDRSILGKNDRGDVYRILRECKLADIKVHLFCMVGHPGSSRKDAERTVSFLLENEAEVDTADLVAFRLDRGTTVPGVRSAPAGECDWSMSTRFEATHPGVLQYEEVCELEEISQEQLWQNVPRLLHPLYRVMSPWSASTEVQRAQLNEVQCLSNCCSTPG